MNIFSNNLLVNGFGAVLIHPNPEQYKNYYLLPPNLASYKLTPNYYCKVYNDLLAEQNKANQPPPAVPQPEPTFASPLDSFYSSMVIPPKPSPKPTQSTAPPPNAQLTKIEEQIPK